MADQPTPPAPPLGETERAPSQNLPLYPPASHIPKGTITPAMAQARVKPGSTPGSGPASGGSSSTAQRARGIGCLVRGHSQHGCTRASRFILAARPDDDLATATPRSLLKSMPVTVRLRSRSAAGIDAGLTAPRPREWALPWRSPRTLRTGQPAAPRGRPRPAARDPKRPSGTWPRRCAAVRTALRASRLHALTGNGLRPSGYTVYRNRRRTPVSRRRRTRRRQRRPRTMPWARPATRPTLPSSAQERRPNPAAPAG